MKKRFNRSDHESDPIDKIQDYGHDRSVYSLARGGRKAMIRKHRRLRLLGLLLPAVLVIVLGILIWPLMPWSQTRDTSRQTAVITTAATAAASWSTQSLPSTAVSQTATAAAILSPAERQARLAAAGDEATTLLKSKSGRFAIYFQNLLTGEKWQTNADQPFVAASSIKLGINTYLYTKIASGEIKADEMLAYDSRPYPTGDYEAGTGSIQYQPNGTRMSVRETSGLSIRISDNCGTNMLIRRLGGIDAVNPFLSGISSQVDYRKSVTYKNYAGQTVSGRHRTCAMDLGSHAVRLYELWKATPAVYQPLLDDLCKTEFDFGIQKGIPAGVQVAHKIGTNGTYSAENDVGIVFAAEPYALCVMTEMANASTAHQIQAAISKIFYSYISGLGA